MAASNLLPDNAPHSYDLRAIASKTGDLPALPGIALKVLQLTKDPNTSARQLEEVIRRDQALAARILKIVNSAMYGLRRDVSTISHAITILGMETVRSVVMAAAMKNMLRSGMRRGPDLGTRLLWDHSMGAAFASRTIAVLARYPNPEEAFLCGLMHDIGKPVLLNNYPTEYAQVFSQVYRGELSFHEMEVQIFGFSHAHVGAIVTEQWNFPRQLSVAIQYHHNPLAAPEAGRLAAITSLANSVLILLEIGFEKNKSLELENDSAASLLGLGKDMLDRVASETRDAVSSMPEFIKM